MAPSGVWLLQEYLIRNSISLPYSSSLVCGPPSILEHFHPLPVLPLVMTLPTKTT